MRGPRSRVKGVGQTYNKGMDPASQPRSVKEPMNPVRLAPCGISFTSTTCSIRASGRHGEDFPRPKWIHARMIRGRKSAYARNKLKARQAGRNGARPPRRPPTAPASALPRANMP